MDILKLPQFAIAQDDLGHEMLFGKGPSPSLIIDTVRSARRQLLENGSGSPAERIFCKARLIELLAAHFNKSQSSTTLLLRNALISVMDDLFPSEEQHTAAVMLKIDEFLVAAASTIGIKDAPHNENWIDGLLRAARLRAELFQAERDLGQQRFKACVLHLDTAVTSRQPNALYLAPPLTTAKPIHLDTALLSWWAWQWLQWKASGVDNIRLDATENFADYLAPQLQLGGTFPQSITALHKYWSATHPGWAVLLRHCLSLQLENSSISEIRVEFDANLADDVNALMLGEQRSGKSSLMFGLEALGKLKLLPHPADSGYGEPGSDYLQDKRTIWQQNTASQMSSSWKTRSFQLYAESQMAGKSMKLCFFDTPGEALGAGRDNALYEDLCRLIDVSTPRVLILLLDASRSLRPQFDTLSKVITDSKHTPLKLDQVLVLVNKVDLLGPPDSSGIGTATHPDIARSLQNLVIDLGMPEQERERQIQLAVNPVVGTIVLDHCRDIVSAIDRAGISVNARRLLTYTQSTYTQDWTNDDRSGGALARFWERYALSDYSDATQAGRSAEFARAYAGHWQLSKERRNAILRAAGSVKNAAAFLRDRIGTPIVRQPGMRQPGMAAAAEGTLAATLPPANLMQGEFETFEQSVGRFTASRRAVEQAATELGTATDKLAALLTDFFGMNPEPVRQRRHSSTDSAGAMSNISAYNWIERYSGKCHRSDGVIRTFVPYYDDPNAAGSPTGMLFAAPGTLTSGGTWRFLGFPHMSGDMRNWYVTLSLQGTEEFQKLWRTGGVVERLLHARSRLLEFSAPDFCEDVQTFWGASLWARLRAFLEEDCELNTVEPSMVRAFFTDYPNRSGMFSRHTGLFSREKELLDHLHVEKTLRDKCWDGGAKKLLWWLEHQAAFRVADNKPFTIEQLSETIVTLLQDVNTLDTALQEWLDAVALHRITAYGLRYNDHPLVRANGADPLEITESSFLQMRHSA